MEVILVGWDIGSLSKDDIIELARSIVEEDYPEAEVEETVDQFIEEYIDEVDDYGDDYSEGFKQALLDWLEEYFDSKLSLYSDGYVGIDFGTSTNIGVVLDTIEELNNSTYGKHLTSTAGEPKMMIVTS